jgi:hypothetical protein
MPLHMSTMSPQRKIMRDTILGRRSALLFNAVVADRQV